MHKLIQIVLTIGMHLLVRLAFSFVGLGTMLWWWVNLPRLGDGEALLTYVSAAVCVLFSLYPWTFRGYWEYVKDPLKVLREEEEDE